MRVTTIDCDYTGRPGIAAAYMVEDAGRVAFVETNTSAAVPRMLAALAEAGRRPEDVDYVIITHIHLDHAGGAGVLMAACPNAVLLAHPRAAPHAIDPTRIVAGASKVYGEDVFARLYGEVRAIDASRVQALDDEAVVSLGSSRLRFLHTRGHANHHFVVHAEAADAVFTGDAFGVLYPALQKNGPFVFPSTSPTDFDAEAAHAAVERMVGLGTAGIYPTHFGWHGGVVALGDQMHRLLDQHSALLEQADREAWEDGELDGRFDREVKAIFEATLVERGLASDALAREVIALDADLNAQGLAFALRKRRYKRRKAAG